MAECLCAKPLLQFCDRFAARWQDECGAKWIFNLDHLLRRIGMRPPRISEVAFNALMGGSANLNLL